jgi:hypothetical protein
VPLGEPPAPQPGETVKDQLMRTFSAVRSRLRVANHSEESGATNGDTEGNGSYPVTAVGTMAAVDPLLAEHQATNGDDPAADTIVDAPTEDAPVVGDAPVVADVPAVEAVPLAIPSADALTSEPAPARPARPPRSRTRPALPLLRRRPRVRKVTRIVRRVDAWGVFKISVIFYVILYIILLVAGVLLWNLANTTGTVANVEGFIRDLFGLKTFEFDGEKLFRASWVLGAILVVAGTGLNVTLAILFNLISDLVGGVRVTVLEEEVVLRERPVVPPPVEPVEFAERVESVEPAMAAELKNSPVVVEPLEPLEPPLEPPAEVVAPPEPDDAPPPTDPLLTRPPRRPRSAPARRKPSNGRSGSTAADASPPAPTVDAEDD